MSQVTATNCRVGTGSTRPDLSHILQNLHTKKLFMANSSFPSSAKDLITLPKLFWEHTYQPNYMLPKECEVENPVANGSVPNRSASNSTSGSGVSRLTTYVFRPDAVDDVWNVKIEQIWADFHSVPSSFDRPVPLVDPIPLNLWTCLPTKTNDKESQLSSHQNGSCNSQSENGTDVTESLKFKPHENNESASTTGGHKLIERVSANKNVRGQTEQLKASLADNNQSGMSMDCKSPLQFSHDSHIQARSTEEVDVPEGSLEERNHMGATGNQSKYSDGTSQK